MKPLVTNLQSVCLAGGSLLLATLLCLAPASSTLAKDEKNPPIKLAIDGSPIQRDGKFTASFSHVVKRVSPSVVKIYATAKPKSAAQNPLMDDPFFRHFFGDVPQGRMPRMPREQGLGSGVVVTSDGYILTNNHVVENADSIKVSFGEGEKDYTAEVVGKDDKTDIALLKVDAKGLPAVTIADSENIEVGDVVFAIGNPFGIGQTVTMGVVSATGRVALGLDYESFIQTDASINPGNSGGALVDAAGRLIGINTAILSRSGGNQGIGFAIPINLARFVMESLVRDGRVVRGFMGAMLQPVNAALAKQFGLTEASGALVSEVVKDSPAGKGGLKDGDVILELDGRPVRDSRSLRLQISQILPGTKIVLGVLRDGDRRKIDIVLKERPSDLASAGDPVRSANESDPLQGVVVADLNESVRKRFRVPESIEGALVTEVQEDSPAAEEGLKVGDVIREINRQKVENADQAIELSERSKGDTILLRVWSRDSSGGGANQYIVIRKEAKK
ncbi:MAG: DegQ family serine endoprotease [Verrucomicrobia bacterium]|nr:DegQ family serine endoprotease [Verrucomicrobiota bacterium]